MVFLNLLDTGDLLDFEGPKHHRTLYREREREYSFIDIAHLILLWNSMTMDKRTDDPELEYQTLQIELQA